MKRSLTMEQALGQRLLLAFQGKDRPSEEIVQALREYRAGGLTFFRSLNIENPAQVRRLTDQLQALVRGLDLPPLLIATDQEGGQLMAIGEGTTPLPGNMALGATGSAELARKAGEVLGRELAAMGVNVNYAPCVDVNNNPINPVVGIRSFGEDPAAVCKLAAAMIQGIQSQGVAATAKHFPGHGDVPSDSHYGLPSVPYSLERLEAVELPPFQAAIDADVQMVMTAHLALPAIDGPDAPPATLSRKILTGLLRQKLGFQGVTITDAMDMHAIRQGEYLGEDALRAFQAGADLLLLTSDSGDQKRVYQALLQAAKNGAVDAGELDASVGRILALKAWLGKQPPAPDLSVVGCAEHRRVADEISEGAVTLVRDQGGLIPLRLRPDQRVAVVTPKPQDLTPADTSSYVVPALASSLRGYHRAVDEFIFPFSPEAEDIAVLCTRLAGYDLLLVGTLNAVNQPGQQMLVRGLLKTGIPTIVAALRLPYDLGSFPEAPTYVCTYGILEPSMRALAKMLFGAGKFSGRLPVGIPELYRAGYRLER
ncbi:MAG: glycoside hydrolase family 3 protein [Anaerolineales bacterium]